MPFRVPATIVACAVAVLLGCGPAPTFPPVDIDAAKSIASGTPLADIERVLGESHPATSTQAKQLDEVMSRMPPEVRSRAQRDTTLAWGDDTNFLVVKVNAEGVAWVTAWRSRLPIERGR